MVARLWNGHRPPLPFRLFFFHPVAPQPTGPTRTAFANLPQGRFSSFYCSPSSCRSVFSSDPSAARLFVNNLQAQAQPSPAHHPVVASPAVVLLTSIANRDPERCISVLSDKSRRFFDKKPVFCSSLRPPTTNPRSVPNLWSPLFPEHHCFGASTRALIENAVAPGRQQEEPRKQQ